MPPKATRPAAPRSTTHSAAESASSRDATSAPSDSAGQNASAASSSAPARPPVQRLQSLNKRTPRGSIGPRPPVAHNDPSQTKPVLKYKPRPATRRSKEERDALLKLEAERYQERLAEAAAIQRAQAPNVRARGGSRGRGGALGVKFGGPVRGRGGTFGARFAGDSRASSISRRSIAQSATASVSLGDISSDESDTELRVSIDQINIEDDSESEDVLVDKKGKKAVTGPARGEDKGLRPIRVERHEHEERVVGVNTEASSSTSAELRRQAREKADDDNALFVEDDSIEEDKDHEPRIKAEPTDGDVFLPDVAPHAATEESLEAPLPRARKKVAVEDPRSLLRTREEIEEFDRHNEDLSLMKGLLAVDEPTLREQSLDDGNTIATDAADSKETTTEGEVAMDKHAGQLFLIQFPPLTPNLAIPTTAEQTTGNGVAAADGVVGLIDTAPQADEPEVKDEVDSVDVQGESLQKPAKLVTATKQQLPAGRAGRMHLHASGRVTMDWGGISFELDRGTDVDFLQEALIASTRSATEAGEERAVWAMGQLSGKFVAQPEWGKLL